MSLKVNWLCFWTPFLLLHIGGPHSISAYSLSDNELWLRYLLGLLIQVGVAIYVYMRFQTESTLTYIAILIFVAGIVKYGERIWILRAASNRQFSNSVFSTPTLATEKSPIHSPSPETMEEYLRHKNAIEGGKYIHRAFCLFKMNIPLFSDLKLRIHRELSNIFLLSPLISAEEAFKLVQIELGFLYDVLYTKTTILHSIVGVILCGICLLSTFAALIAFSIMVGKSGYPRVDISITYLLLGGAIFLDIYSAISHAFSDSTMLLLTIQSKTVHKFVGRTVVSWLVCCKARKKGVVSMAQHSLMDYCLKAKASGWTTILRRLDTEDILEKFWWTTWKQVNIDLKKFILLHLQEKFKQYKPIKEKYGDEESNSVPEVFDYEVLLGILKERENHALHSKEIKEFKWSIDDIEFSHSILLWHIATFLLFYNDHKKYSGGVLGPYCQISVLLSDYMMYLLLVRPLMLPKGIGEVRIRDTREEVIIFFGKETSLTNNDATSALLNKNDDLLSIHKKSVLRDGCTLALKLQGLVEESLWDHEAKWEMTAHVWMEMLAFAANKCGWREDATQLRHGGELLTHVALLMAHLGLTEHIQIAQPSSELPSLGPDLGRDSQQLSSESPSLGLDLRWDWDGLSHLAYYLA